MSPCLSAAIATEGGRKRDDGRNPGTVQVATILRFCRQEFLFRVVSTVTPPDQRV